MYRLIFVTSVLLSTASVLYSGIVLNRVEEHGITGTHIGGDIIILAYLAPSMAIVMALTTTFVKCKYSKTLTFTALTINIAALGIWLWLHMSGTVISHGTMMQNRS